MGPPFLSLLLLSVRVRLYLHVSYSTFNLSKLLLLLDFSGYRVAR
jgi:hypothetical protein